MTWRFLFAGFFFWPLQASAVELQHTPVVTGTTGLIQVPVEVLNTGSVPLSCTAELAHWYSISLGETLPGGRKLIDLWFDPATGTYLILNDKQNNMPVEALWCGLAGRAYQTRAAIELDRSRGARPSARSVACANSADRLVCK